MLVDPQIEILGQLDAAPPLPPPLLNGGGREGREGGGGEGGKVSSPPLKVREFAATRDITHSTSPPLRLTQCFATL